MGVAKASEVRMLRGENIITMFAYINPVGDDVSQHLLVVSGIREQEDCALEFLRLLISTTFHNFAGNAYFAYGAVGRDVRKS